MPSFFISSPPAIGQVLWKWISDGSLFYQSAITAFEAFSGFFLGALLGVGAGILLARVGRLADVLNPFIMAFYSLPKVGCSPPRGEGIGRTVPKEVTRQTMRPRLLPATRTPSYRPTKRHRMLHRSIPLASVRQKADAVLWLGASVPCRKTFPP